MKRGVLLLLAVSACRTEAPNIADVAEQDAALSFVFADAEPGAITALTVPEPAPSDDHLAAYATAVPKAGKSIGHTSVVFRLDFATDAGALRAAYKPESKRGHKRYRGEVAAYRLARAFHVTNVPPATVRVFDRAALRAVVGPGMFDDEVVDRGGRVYGALMPWIDKLEFAPLESPAEKARWQKQLQTGSDIPDADKALDAQIATLIVFDTLTGNWDRWSGAQIGVDGSAAGGTSQARAVPKATETLLFVDNDASFFDPIPPAFDRQMALLRAIDRFPRALVDRLRHADAVFIADALGDEEPGSPLLAPRVVAACDDRRKTILGVVDRKIATFGEAAVLYFP